MSLAWINPLYFAGILLLTLPVLIHLVQKQQASGIKFPSLMFLHKIPQQQKRRLVVRHWILLLLRCLLLLLLVLAFARPFFDRTDAAIASGDGLRDSVIVLDRSYSMGVADQWRQAQEAALDFVAAKRPRDRVGLILFDDEVEVVSDLSADGAGLRAIVERQRPGMRGTRLRIAVEQADRLLAASTAEEQQILLISDFRAEDSRSEVPEITAGIGIRVHPVEMAELANSGIVAVDILPSGRAAADEFRLEVDLVNYADEALEQQLELELDGRVVERRQLRLEPGTAATEVFDQLSVAGNLARGLLRLGDDGLSLDNEAYFVFSTQQRIPILVVEPGVARDNQSLYLENALELSRNPAFRVRVSDWERLAAADLKNYAVIVINDAPLPGGAMAAALREFVSAGGGLLVAVGDAIAGNWPGGEGGYLPGQLQRRVDAPAGGAFRVSRVAGDHALSGLDLTPASIFSYRAIDAGADDRVIAFYDDGAGFLFERSHGGGRVMVMNTTLDTLWNNLALEPIFLPFLHRGLNYLAAHESHPHSVRVGEVVDVVRYARALAGSDAVVAAAASSSLTVEPPAGAEIRLQRAQPLLALEQRGFYQVHRVTPAESEVVLAVNVDPAEAALEKLDVARFVEEIKTLARPPRGERLSTRRAEQHEQQQQLWYAILSLALILMLLEAFAANWIAVRRSRAA